MPFRARSWRAWILLLGSALVLTTGPGFASIAPQEQASTFSKIFAFDRELSGGEVSLLIVHSGSGSERELAALEAAFRAEGVRVSTVSPTDLENGLSGAQVAYFYPEAATESALSTVRSVGVLSIAGAPDLAQRGLVSVALEEVDGKAKIVVNLPRLEAEGHELSSQLLKIARIVSEIAVSGAAPATPELQLPVLLSSDPLVYPAMAKRLRVQGVVVVRVLVGESGEVVQTEIQRGVSQTTNTRAPASVYEAMDEAAIEMAQSARFQPASQGGSPVQAWFRLVVPFRL